MNGDKLISWTFGFIFVVGVLGLIGLWYLALFALAALIFLVLLVVSRRQRSSTQDILRFRPGQIVPAEVWARAKGLAPATAPDALDVSLVELDKYSSNWDQFRQKVQVDRAGNVDVFGYLIAYKTPTADRGVIFAYDRLILGEIRQVELELYFDAVWSAGGIVHVLCRCAFDEQLRISSATVNLPLFTSQPGSIMPAREQAAWNAIWRGIRGKGPE